MAGWSLNFHGHAEALRRTPIGTTFVGLRSVPSIILDMLVRLGCGRSLASIDNGEADGRVRMAPKIRQGSSRGLRARRKTKTGQHEVEQHSETALVSASMEGLSVELCKGTPACRWGMSSLHLHLRV